MKPHIPLALLSSLMVAHVIAKTGEPTRPAAQEIIVKIKPAHPRLLATAADFDHLKTVVANGEAAKFMAVIQHNADDLLKAAPSKYEIPDGKRLLATSRRVLDRTLTLGLVFRTTGDKRHAERLWKELDAAAHFKDWNPSHFLDTAEMTTAFAIGYDWLYDTWTPEQRATLRQAIVSMGLNQALPLYRKQKGWTVANHNWNQVCNGGMTLGALAIGDEESEIAGEILSNAIASVPRAMREFAPDGAWGEGPGYWDYAVMYNVFMLAAMDTALGTDFGLSKIEGFSKAADFPIQITGPLGRTFNYADAGDGGSGGPSILWLTTTFQRPDHAAWRIARARSKPHPLDLIYGATWFEHPPTMASAPLAKYFRGPEVVTMRSAWNDPKATCIAFKGGDNRVNHGHLDLGSFVLDAAGERWAVDLGADDYNLPGYFGPQRWDYYRMRAEGHNTLVFAPDAKPDQDLKAKSKIIRFSDREGASFAIADLSAAYARHATSVKRGVHLQGTDVVIQDEIAMASPSDTWWFMHTAAKIECHGTTATLTQDGHHLTATILSPAGAQFQQLRSEPMSTSPHPPRQQVKHPSRHAQKLAIHCTPATSQRITVLLTAEDAAATKVAVLPLEGWK